MFRWTVLIFSFGTLVVSCTSTSEDPRRTKSGAEAAVDSMARPGRVGVEDAEIPAAVRAIEQEIDKTSVILAERIDIYVSKNYQFDVSLIGDVVSKDMDGGAGNERHALGKAQAFVRNLQLRADQGIRVRVASAGTEPFIKIRARGRCSHIIPEAAGGTEAIRRAQVLTIENDVVRYYQPGETPAAWYDDLERDTFNRAREQR